MNTLVLAGDEGIFVVGVMAIAGAACVIVGLILDHMKKMMTIRAREESRREIAAYVAEGSITADDAAKIISAGTSARKSGAPSDSPTPGAKA